MVDRFSFLSNFIWVVNLFVILILSAMISTLAIEERSEAFAIRRVEGASVGQVVAPPVVEGIVLALVAIPLGYAISELAFRQFVLPVLSWPALIRWRTSLSPRRCYCSSRRVAMASPHVASRGAIRPWCCRASSRGPRAFIDDRRATLLLLYTRSRVPTLGVCRSEARRTQLARTRVCGDVTAVVQIGS